jgi:DNA-binding transcriptional regulator YiaG
MGTESDFKRSSWVFYSAKKASEAALDEKRIRPAWRVNLAYCPRCRFMMSPKSKAKTGVCLSCYMRKTHPTYVAMRRGDMSKWRKAFGISQIELAVECKTAQSAISRFERRSKVPLRIAAGLARLLVAKLRQPGNQIDAQRLIKSWPMFMDFAIDA